MTGSLETVKRKLRRSEKYVDGLTEELVRFDNSNAYRIDRKVDPKDGATVLEFYVLREPDPEWEITVGEIAHQMRSSLDHIVAQLVAFNGGNPHKHRGGWPIISKAEDYWNVKPPRKKSLRDTLLAGVKPAHRTIVDSLQPYQRGKRLAVHDPLFRLNEVVDIPDKHRIGTPAVFVLRSSAVAKVTGFETITIFGRHHGLPEDLSPAIGETIQHGTEILRYGGIRTTTGPGALPPGEVKMEAVRIGVCFGPSRVFVFELRRILDYINVEVVPRFEPLFRP